MEWLDVSFSEEVVTTTKDDPKRTVDMVLLLTISLLLGTIYSEGPNTDQPDMYKLINMLFLNEDANLNGQITYAEGSDVFQAFDKNGDGTVTYGEFVDGWMSLTSQTKAVADAYFHVADLNHDKVIYQKDYAMMYTVFDLNYDGALSSQEFAKEAENSVFKREYSFSIIPTHCRNVRATPFSELFEKSDKDQDEFLTQAEFRMSFQSFDMDGNPRFDNREFVDGWASLDYALQSDADSLFRSIDANGDHYITDADMDKLFGQYKRNAYELDLQEVAYGGKLTAKDTLTRIATLPHSLEEALLMG